MVDKQADNKKNNHNALIAHDKHSFTEQELIDQNIPEQEAREILQWDAFELINNIDKETSDSILSFFIELNQTQTRPESISKTIVSIYNKWCNSTRYKRTA